MPNKPNYYQILGVNNTASVEEIRKAFRDGALKWHPDRNKDANAEEKFKDLNEAWGILSNETKRRSYDKKLASETRSSEVNEQGFSRQTKKAQNQKVDFNNEFNDIFSSFFRDTDGIFSGGKSDFSKSFFGENSYGSRKNDDFIYLTEVDKGLFLALVGAYASTADGKWTVSKDPKDSRDYIPRNFYSVERKNGKVKVYRTVADWRDSFSYDKPIYIKESEGSLNYKKDKEYSPTSLFGEYYLTGQGEKLIRPTSLFIPLNFDIFLNGMKSIAYKLSEIKGKDGSVTVSEEVNDINKYYRGIPRGVRAPESSSFYSTDNSRIDVQKVKIKDFWHEVRSAEGLVRKEGSNGKVEGSGMMG